LFKNFYREHKSALRERERKHRQAIAAAKRNREQASKFLKETMSRYLDISYEASHVWEKQKKF